MLVSPTSLMIIGFLSFFTFIAIGIIIVLALLNKNKNQFAYSEQQKQTKTNIQKSQIRKKELLTDTEQLFFKHLTHALPDFYIFTQVSFGALITHNGQENFSVRKYFAQKMADFIIVNHSFEVLAIIELDDKTHDRQKAQDRDQKRDELLYQAGYKVIRYRCECLPTYETMRRDVIEDSAA